jgi:hypothetical protein
VTETLALVNHRLKRMSIMSRANIFPREDQEDSPPVALVEREYSDSKVGSQAVVDQGALVIVSDG